MIPAPPGIVARYKLDTPSGSQYDTKRVVAFDDEGRALIVTDRQTAHLGRADTYSNFHDLTDDFAPGEQPQFAQLIPAGGWRVEYTYADGTKWSTPLAAWGMRANGDVDPLQSDADGFVSPVDPPKGGDLRIYHPDADPIDEAE